MHLSPGFPSVPLQAQRLFLCQSPSSCLKDKLPFLVLHNTNEAAGKLGELCARGGRRRRRCPSSRAVAAGWRCCSGCCWKLAAKEMPSGRKISDFVRGKRASGVLPSSPCPRVLGMLRGPGWREVTGGLGADVGRWEGCGKACSDRVQREKLGFPS